MNRRPYTTTKGRNQQVFIAKPLAYATDATYKAFVTDAADGEIGLFVVPANGNEADSTIKANALTAGQKYFIAVKLADKNIRKSQVFTFGSASNTISYSAYRAFTRQVTHLGYDGTSGDTGLTVTVNKTFGFTIIETTPGNEPAPFWDFDYTATAADDEFSVLSKLISRVNDRQDIVNRDESTILSAKLISNGTFTELLMDATMTYDSKTVSATAHGLTVGNILRIVGDVYKVATIVDANTFTLDRKYQGVSGLLDVSGLADADSIGTLAGITSYGIQLTATLDGVHFRVSLSEALYDAATSTVGSPSYTTPFAVGNGGNEAILELQKEGDVYDGVTTLNIAFKEDYGQSPSMVVAGINYDTFIFKAVNTVQAASAIVSQQVHTLFTCMAIPTTGSTPATPIAAIKTVLGL